MTRKTDDEYAATAADYSANPPTADEVLDEPTANYAILRNGRPPKDTKSAGRTPTTSIRLPRELRNEINALARENNVKPSEIIRRAAERYVREERQRRATTR